MKFLDSVKEAIVQNIINSTEESIAPTLPYRMESALRYGRRGWRVFPVTDKKVPMIKGWPQKATTDVATITQWWTQYPKANVGIATGPGSGIWVLDIDVKNGVDGIDSIEKIFGAPQVGEHDLAVQTPSGGLHLYFRWDDSIPVTVHANVLPGVDIRGKTGFIVAPPSSFRVDGEECFYRFNDENYTVPDAPEWAREIALVSLNPTPPATQQGGHQATSQFDVREVMEGVSQGNRDNALFRYVCHLRGCDVPYDLAEGFVLAAASRCVPPFDEQIVVDKLKRVYQNLPVRTSVFSLKEGNHND